MHIKLFKIFESRNIVRILITSAIIGDLTQAKTFLLKREFSDVHIVGLSKIARVEDVFARRLQVQECPAKEIKDCIQNTLNPLGVAVVIEARNICMSTRGVHGLVYYTADSDAIITKGIVNLLIRVLSGRAAQEIIDSKLEYLDAIGIREHLSPTRSNGLVSMIKQMKMYAFAFQLKNK